MGTRAGADGRLEARGSLGAGSDSPSEVPASDAPEDDSAEDELDRLCGFKNDKASDSLFDLGEPPSGVVLGVFGSEICSGEEVRGIGDSWSRDLDAGGSEWRSGRVGRDC